MGSASQTRDYGVGGVVVPGRWHAAVRSLVRDYSALAGGVIFFLMVMSGIFAPVLSHYDPIAQNTRIRLQGSSRVHLLGTDDFGRDIFTRLLYGSRSIMLIAFVSIILALVAGTSLGALAGYFGDWAELLIMRLTDVMLAFPLVLLAIVIVVALGPGTSNLILAIGISQIPIFARLAHSLTLSVRYREYVQAARCLGSSDRHILISHILPNIATPLLVQATTTMALAILSATALNFLGLGIQPPTSDWGAMIADFRRFIFDRPLLALYPGMAIAVTVLSLNLLSDALIEILDPTTRRMLG